jgi:hypothetical protein
MVASIERLPRAGEPDGLTPAQRLASASFGSIFTVLFTTPLDVVKVRMQVRRLRALTAAERQNHAPRCRWTRGATAGRPLRWSTLCAKRAR